MRRLSALFVCCLGLTLAPVAVAPAAGGSPSGSTATAPQQLVHAYPLGPQRLCCSSHKGGSQPVATPPQQRARTVGRPGGAGGSSGSSSLGLIALLAVVALLVGVLATVVVRRRQKAPAAAPDAATAGAVTADAVPASPPKLVPPGRYVVDARPSFSATIGPTPGWSSNTVWHSGLKPPHKSRTERERPEGTAAQELEYRRGDAAGNAGAAFNLGVLLHRRGDLAGAAEAYWRAEERGDGDAAFNLGVLLYEAGNLDGAEMAWRRCVERRDARAAANLGYLLQRRGDLEGALLAHADAERWSEAEAEPPASAAWDARERGMAPAGTGRGSREWEQEEPEGTAALEFEYGRGDAAGDAGAAFNLGVLLHKRGDLGGAAEAYWRAEERGDGDAAFNLGVLLYEAGDLDGAEMAWRRCVERRHAKAAANLGYLLQRRGDLEGALLAHADAERWRETEGAEVTTNRGDPDPVSSAAVSGAGNRSHER
jgi:tetratricopeptide (TPR) repeat protein